MHIEVLPLPALLLTARPDETGPAEDSASVRARVVRARRHQLGRQGKVNARLGNREIARHCALPDGAGPFLERAIERLGLSARAYHRILRLARTIADLDDAATIRLDDIAEAIGYRRFDRSIG